jgi:hypothetical protein
MTYASQADIAYLTLLEVRSGPDTSYGWTEVAEVVGLTPPSDSVDEHEVTHMQSPGGVKEHIAGLSDPGDMSVKINHIPGSDTDEFILAWKSSRQRRDTRITYPSGRTQQLTTFVKGYVPDELTPNGPMTATLSLRNASASTFTAAP